jgi:hypothetical protein
MEIVKRLNSSYKIQTTPADSNVTIDSPELIVTGNLIVYGTETAIESTIMVIDDNVIVLNQGEVGNVISGGGVTAGTAGIEIFRGDALPSVDLLWNEVVDKWQITENGIDYVNILSSSTGSIVIEDDLNPTLGGNLNANGFTILSTVSNVNFNGNLQLNNTLVEPSAVTDATVVYAAPPAGGASGVYVVNAPVGTQELVTKTRAFGFSLIL